MVEKLIECVPNISEGRNQKIIMTIAEVVQSVDGVKLLNIDSGKSANRTVYTFVGAPDRVVEAAFHLYKTVTALVDMQTQTGEHPRMGAVDVCPLVPLQNISIEETHKYAVELARRVGKELRFPTFLYATSANAPHKVNLANIRRGEYEGMAEKMKEEKWKPDYGPPVFNPRTGTTAIGAREFLIAFNVNLNTESVEIATAIAQDVRESGKIIRDDKGQKRRVPGRCKGLKAIGWVIEEFKCAQVSMNITDLRETGIYEAFEACRESAAQYGVIVTGAELVGLVPKREMVYAGLKYLQKEGTDLGVPEMELVHLAYKKMNLSSVKPFVIKERVIEYCMGTDEKYFNSVEMMDLIEDLASANVSHISFSVANAFLSARRIKEILQKGSSYPQSQEPLEKQRIALVKVEGIQDELMNLLEAVTFADKQYYEIQNLPKGGQRYTEMRELSTANAVLYELRLILKVLEKCVVLASLIKSVGKGGKLEEDSELSVRYIKLATHTSMERLRHKSDKVEYRSVVEDLREKGNRMYEKIKTDLKYRS